jgi:hypothetical protein
MGGGGKGGAPAPPDYSGIAAASEKAADLSYKTAQDQLNWAKQTYGSDRELADKVVNSALSTSAANNAAAARDRARYEETYQPLENELVADAKSYSSPERIALERGKAEANVANQFDQQREAALQNLEGFGVDPSTLRSASMNIGMRAAQGAATAAAGNQSTAQTEAIGRALRSEALNIGKGYPGQVAGTYGTALQAGNQAINGQLATTASGANTMGTAPQWMGAGNQALGTWGNTLNMGYQNQLSAWKASQDDGGMGALLGAGVGLASKIPGFAQGGQVDGNQTPGGAIPTHASPSGGSAVDDVPAKLTVGEFVLPKDVMQWKGEEWAQKEIQKARDAKQQAVAKPTVGTAPVEEPTFVSRPQQGALPTG